MHQRSSVTTVRAHGTRLNNARMLLGPAFVAALAYVDPGNVAANLTAGARYGYLLVWVLVAASAMAMLIQYQSAKLGIVTGRTLPAVVADGLERRGGHGLRIAYGAQAQFVAVATEIAEVVGGAIALWLLFGVPLWLGGIIVGFVSLGLLTVLSRRGEKIFELVILAVLAVVALGFLAGLFWSRPSAPELVGGLVPRLAGTDTVLLAAAMLGATVMPHAIYVHSALARDRHFPTGGGLGAAAVRHLLKITRVDVGLALVVAGSVNIGMLVLAAATLQSGQSTDSIEAAHSSLGVTLGVLPATLFAIGLLAAGIGSTAVGAHAGATIIGDALRLPIPMLARRLFSVVPAVALLLTPIPPTQILVISQVVLSFGIPFALVPLIIATGSRSLMGSHADSWPLRVASWTSAAAIVVLNVALLYLTFTGRG